MHCIRSDGIALATLSLVYGAMLLGNLLLLFSVGVFTDDELQSKPGAIIEIIIFQI